MCGRLYRRATCKPHITMSQTRFADAVISMFKGAAVIASPPVNGAKFYSLLLKAYWQSETAS